MFGLFVEETVRSDRGLPAPQQCLQLVAFSDSDARYINLNNGDYNLLSARPKVSFRAVVSARLFSHTPLSALKIGCYYLARREVMGRPWRFILLTAGRGRAGTTLSSF